MSIFLTVLGMIMCYVPNFIPEDMENTRKDLRVIMCFILSAQLILTALILSQL